MGALVFVLIIYTVVCTAIRYTRYTLACDDGNDSGGGGGESVASAEADAAAAVSSPYTIRLISS